MTRPVFFATTESATRADIPSWFQNAGIGVSARLEGSEGRHGAVVMRLGVGEKLDLVDGFGTRLTCEVKGSDKNGLDLIIIGIDHEIRLKPELVLVQALAKNGRDEQAIETATEVGIDRIIPWQAGHSIVRWSGAKKERGRKKWASVARVAAKQSRRAWEPRVDPVSDTPALAQWVKDRVSEGAVCLICHEEASDTLTGYLRDQHNTLRNSSSIILIVGPEGGISPDEISALSFSGAQPLVLGPHVLRSSTAGPIAAALISSVLGRFDLSTPDTEICLAE